MIDLGFDDSKGTLSRIFHRLKALLILLRIAVSAQVSLITVDNAKSFLGKAIKLLDGFKKNAYCISKVSAPLHPEWYEAYFVRALNDQEIRKNLLGKKPGHFSAYEKKDYIGRYLMYSEYEAKGSDIKGYPDDRLIMGYPKLLPTWLDYAGTCEVNWDHQLLVGDDFFITVLLLSKDVYLYNPDDSVDVFLSEILVSVRRYYKNELIVLKNKPKVGTPVNDWLGDYVEALEDERVILSSVPTPFLAQRSKLMFMVGDTTACFDFIIREVPSIEHVRYSEGLIKNYPEQSGWSTYKICRTSTVTELDQAIADIHAGLFHPMSVAQVKKIISHRDDEAFVNEL